MLLVNSVEVDVILLVLEEDFHILGDLHVTVGQLEVPIAGFFGIGFGLLFQWESFREVILLLEAFSLVDFEELFETIH